MFSIFLDQDSAPSFVTTKFLQTSKNQASSCDYYIFLAAKHIRIIYVPIHGKDVNWTRKHLIWEEEVAIQMDIGTPVPSMRIRQARSSITHTGL